ncbi:MAG: hypothetical protein V1754_08410 [Pseudomonadota bacterium]
MNQAQSVLDRVSAKYEKSIAAGEKAQESLDQQTEGVGFLYSLASEAVFNWELRDQERAFLDSIFQEVVGEIDQIARNSQYEGVSLLQGELQNQEEIYVSNLNTTAEGLRLNNLSISTREDAYHAFDAVISAYEHVSNSQATVMEDIYKYQGINETLRAQITQMSTMQSTLNASLASRQMGGQIGGQSLQNGLSGLLIDMVG